MGLQAVRTKYGADSKQAAAAAAMLRGTLAEVWAALHDATGERPVLASFLCLLNTCKKRFVLNLCWLMPVKTPAQ